MEQIALQKNEKEELTKSNETGFQLEQDQLDPSDPFLDKTEVAVLRPLLDKIRCTQDVKNISEDKLDSLNDEIRDF